MYHSITIGSKNTWDDWHLIPASRPVFVPPVVKTNSIDYINSDGSLDLTENLTDEPKYGNRSGSFSFIVENGHTNWAVLYSEIMAYLHGKKYQARLEDDPDYYYEGRFAVSSWTSGAQYSTITIAYDVAPFPVYDPLDEE